MRPLDGIKVVALEHAIAAPFCTRQLADLGARVIKIERPGAGDFARGYDERVSGLSSHFVWTNRSKESLLHRLLADADVLVQNLAPGAADRLGLSYEALSEKYPRIIVCGISGYGPDGPYRDKKAYDLLIQSESGFLSVTGTPEAPAKAGCSIADIAAGMYAYTNILAALLQRQKTGRGCRIDVSMLESMAEWMGFPLYYAIDGQSPPPRAAAAHATIFPYGPFVAGDGQTVMLGLQNEREWKVFCDKVLEKNASRRIRGVSRTAKCCARRSAKCLRISPRRNCSRVSTKSASQTRSSMKCATCGTIRSSPHVPAGPKWRPLQEGFPRCCRRACPRRSSRAWAPFPRSDSTLRRSSRNWATPLPRSTGCALRTRSDMQR